MRRNWSLTTLGVLDDTNQVSKQNASRGNVEAVDATIPIWDLGVLRQLSWITRVFPMEYPDIHDEEAEQKELEDQPCKDDFLASRICTSTPSRLKSNACELGNERNQISKHKKRSRGAGAHECIVSGVQGANEAT